MNITIILEVIASAFVMAASLAAFLKKPAMAFRPSGKIVDRKSRRSN